MGLGLGEGRSKFLGGVVILALVAVLAAIGDGTLVAARAHARADNITSFALLVKGVGREVHFLVDELAQGDAAFHETFAIGDNLDVRALVHVSGEEDPDVRRSRRHGHRIFGVELGPGFKVRVHDLGGLQVGKVGTELEEVVRQVGVFEETLLLNVLGDKFSRLELSAENGVLVAVGGRVLGSERTFLDEVVAEVLGALGTALSCGGTDLEDKGDVDVELVVGTNLVLEGIPE